MKFIVTKELGRLAKWLRILGFDADYFKDDERRKLIIKSLRDDRIILTRDSKLSQYTGVKIIHITSDFVDAQLKQLLSENKLELDEGKFFRRCVICNVELDEVDKSRIESAVPEYVYNTQNFFVKCPNCHRVYWRGTHWDNVLNFTRGFL